ncbi:MAG: alpha/beta hydrolase [Rhodospirillaceae bacterium]
MNGEALETPGAPPPAPGPGACPWSFDWFRAPGERRLRYGRVTVAAPRGTVVLFPGRCEYLRKYDELASEWRDRGFQVFALEWYGQGLSDRPLHNRHKCHVSDFTGHDQDFRAWDQAVVQPLAVGPAVLFGHSMGGLIGLGVLATTPARFAAAVLTAPMVEIATRPWPLPLARWLARAATALGYGEAYAFGQGDYDAAVDAVFAGNPVTGDAERFRRIHDGYRINPRLCVGGVTFGWLAASFRAQAAVARPERLRAIATPVLLLIAGQDRLTPPAAQRRLGRRLPAAVIREDAAARHDLMAEEDPVRRRVWLEIDRFLSEIIRTH